MSLVNVFYRILLLFTYFKLSCSMKHGFVQKFAKNGAQNGVVIVGSVDGMLVGLDLKTGNTKWTFNTGGPLVRSTTRKQDAVMKTSVGNVQEPFVPRQVYSFLPGLDGKLYSLSQSGVLEELEFTVMDLVLSGKPERPKQPQLENTFLMGQKHTKMFGIALNSGIIQAVGQDESNGPYKKKESMLYIGRSEYTCQALYVTNGSVSWRASVAQLFVYSPQPQCPNRYAMGDMKILQEQVYPELSVEMQRGQQHAIIVARDPSDGRIMWKYEVGELLVSLHGITRNGKVFFQESLISPTMKTYTVDKRIGHESMKHENTLNAVAELAVSEKAVKAKNMYDSYDEAHLYVLPRNLKDAYRTTDVSTLISPVEPHPFTEWKEPLKPQFTAVNAQGLYMSWKTFAMVLLVVSFVGALVGMQCYRKSKASTKTLDLVKTSQSKPDMFRSLTSQISQQGPLLNDLNPMSNHPSFKRSVSLGTINSTNRFAQESNGFSIFSPSGNASPSVNLQKPLQIDENDDVNHGVEPRLSCPNLPNFPMDEMHTKFWGDSSESSQGSMVDMERSAKAIPKKPPPPYSNGSTPTEAENGPTLKAYDRASSDLPNSMNRFINDFAKLRTLGKGGFGEVFLVEHRIDGTLYAVKRIGICKGSDTGEKDKVFREVKILAKLNHLNIVRYNQAWCEKMTEEESEIQNAMDDEFGSNILSDGTDESEHSKASSALEPLSFRASSEDRWQWKDSKSGSVHSPVMAVTKNSKNKAKEKRVIKLREPLDHWLYIQMEYCKSSLRDYLDLTERTSLDRQPILSIFVQIVKGLHFVHSSGLIHRDLKPANILFVDGDYKLIKLGDFGLCRNVMKLDATSLQPGVRGKLGDLSNRFMGGASSDHTMGVGTFIYASPEQLKGKWYDSRTDLYSLGMILLEMCYPKFDTAMERYHIMQDARNGTFHLPAFPEVLYMIQKLLSPDPKKRPLPPRIIAWAEALLE